MRVEVLQRTDDLNHIALNFKLMESLTSSDKLIQSLIGTKLQQDVDVFIVFKEVLEPNDVRVMQTSVNFDLAHQLLFGSALGKGRFGDNFGR